MQKRFTPDAGGVFPEWEEKTIEEACNVNVSNGTPGDKFIYIELGDINKYGLLKRKNLIQKHWMMDGMSPSEIIKKDI